MSAKIEKREADWFLNGEKLPGITVEAARSYRQFGYWADRTLGDLIDEAARKWPDRMALIHAEKRLSFRQLNALTDRVALGFLGLGLRPQDMVAVQLPNTVEHVVTILALAKIGAICNLIVPLMREKEVTYIINHCKSKAIIVPHQYHKFDFVNMIRNLSANKAVPSLQMIIATGAGTPQSGVIRFDTLLDGARTGKSGADDLKKFRPDPDDISMIGFTSGTTALPKAYFHTHNTEYANSYNCMLADSYPFLHKPSVNLALPGFGWMYGRFCNILTGLIEGATNIIVDPLEPASVLEAVKREKPTHLHAAPALYRLIADGLVELQQSGAANLEVLHYAGSVMPYETARKLKNLGHLVSCYGLSEGSPICSTSIIDSPEAQMYTAGRPSWGNKVALMDPDGKRLGVNQEGEILLKGPGLIPGYFNQREANSQAFLENGFFRTGDLGFVDESGFMHITGRNKDVIDRGGVKFSAREVEELILSHPSVKDVAMVGMPDPKLGERSCAYVVLRESRSLKLDELVDSLRKAGLATHKLPERLEFIDALPYTATGKIQKYILRERIAKMLQSENADAANAR